MWLVICGFSIYLKIILVWLCGFIMNMIKYAYNLHFKRWILKKGTGRSSFKGWDLSRDQREVYSTLSSFHRALFLKGIFTSSTGDPESPWNHWENSLGTCSCVWVGKWRLGNGRQMQNSGKAGGTRRNLSIDKSFGSTQLSWNRSTLLHFHIYEGPTMSWGLFQALYTG